MLAYDKYCFSHLFLYSSSFTKYLMSVLLIVIAHNGHLDNGSHCMKKYANRTDHKTTRLVKIVKTFWFFSFVKRLNTTTHSLGFWIHVFCGNKYLLIINVSFFAFMGVFGIGYLLSKHVSLFGDITIKKDYCKIR